MKNNRILILMGIPAPYMLGGPPTHLPFLVDYFKKNSEFEIKTFYFGSKTVGKESIINKLWNTLRTLMLFVIYIIRYRPNIVHLNSAFGKGSILRDVLFSVTSKLFNQNLIFKIHGSHYDLLYTKNIAFLLIIKLYFWGVKKIGVLSEIEKNEFIERFGNKNKIIVLKNIIEPKKTLNENIYFKKEFLKTYGLFVSRIEEKKGLDDIILALPAIIYEYPNFNLVVVGNGSKMESYKEMAIKLKIDKNIIWLGYIKNENISIIYKQVDLFLFSSHFPEGMPMSLIDALDEGLPIVTTKVRFALSYFKEFKNCLFIEKGNSQDIVIKVKMLLSDKILRETMYKNNINFNKAFSKNIVGEEFSILYKQMIYNK